MISWSPATSLLRSRLTSCRANSPQNYPVFAKLFSTESRINYRLPNMTRGSHLAQELVVVLVFVCDKQWHNRLTHLHIFFKKREGGEWHGRFSCYLGFGSYWKPFSDVSRVEPTVFIQGLCGLLRVFQVSFEHISPLNADLKETNKLGSTTFLGFI